uniref:Ld-13 n=1 Tax=Lymantria dispar multicapsid nuclear polyhedrosis virus TaxID=10449 RepID=A0A513WW56_NPVLD|nr:Ld-13 [Lymantria dispar multiple nucleopolyhedrovirus]
MFLDILYFIKSGYISYTLADVPPLFISIPNIPIPHKIWLYFLHTS